MEVRTPAFYQGLRHGCPNSKDTRRNVKRPPSMGRVEEEMGWGPTACFDTGLHVPGGGGNHRESHVAEASVEEATEVSGNSALEMPRSYSKEL